MLSFSLDHYKNFPFCVCVFLLLVVVADLIASTLVTSRLIGVRTEPQGAWGITKKKSSFKVTVLKDITK